jgi:murein DD-endopeptidase MepM/ murein hydrolase activator NlpD
LDQPVGPNVALPPLPTGRDPKHLAFPASRVESYLRPPPGYKFEYPPSAIDYSIATSSAFYSMPLGSLSPVRFVFDDSLAKAFDVTPKAMKSSPPKAELPYLAPPMANIERRRPIAGSFFFGANRRVKNGPPRPHYGVDIHAAVGEQIYAGARGTVWSFDPYPGARGIRLELDDARLSAGMFYVGLRPGLRSGMHVEEGELLGTVLPQTDKRVPAHVHFELQIPTISRTKAPYRPYIDPTPYFEFWQSGTRPSSWRALPRQSPLRGDAPVSRILP